MPYKVNPKYPYLEYSELTNIIYIRKNLSTKIDVTDQAKGFVEYILNQEEIEKQNNTCKCEYPIFPLDGSRICKKC